MKKLLVFLLFGMFFISFASAFEWDNKEFYDEATDTYTIRDSILGIPTTKVSEISREGLIREGATTVNLDFNYTLYEDNYENPFKYLRLDKLVRGRWIEGEQVPFEILIKQGTRLENEDIYTQSCSPDAQNLSNQICISSKTGSREINVDNYIPLDQTNLRGGNYAIRLVLEKGIFDESDWILNLNGRELLEWDFLGNSLQAYWTFDNADRTVAFNVDNNSINNFTDIVGPGKSSDSKVGSFAMQFNVSESDNMNNSINGSLLEDFSWSFWVNLTNESTEEKILGHPDVASGNRFMEIQGGDVRFEIGASSVVAPLTAHEWHFVVATWGNSTSTARIFVDNDNVANTTSVTIQPNWHENFRLGAWGVAPSQFLNGTLDEVGYWDVPLTADNVNTLWNSGDGTPFPNPQFPSAGPNITLNHPDDNAIFNVSPIGIHFNATIEDSLNETNASLFINGAVNFSILTPTNLSELFTNVTFTDGVYTWFVNATDSDGENTTSSTRNFTIDTIPPNLTITFPTNGTSILTLTSTVNVTLNVSVSDNVDLDSCFFFNSTANITLTCPNNASVVLGPGFHTLIYYANDTAGNLQQNATTLFVNAVNETWFFIDPIIENTLQDINFILTATNIDTFTGSTFYNNTNFTASSITFNSTQANITTRVNSTGVDVATNITLFTNYSLNGINSTSQEINQTVLFINIDDCSTFTNRILNFTVVDEKEQTFIPNATIEVAVNIFDQSRANLILNVSNNFTNPVGICLNINLTSDAIYSLDSVVRYEKPLEYANEYFNTINFSLTNNSEPQDITLFDLNISDSTPFKIIFTDQFLTPLANVLVFIERQYVSEDAFKVVELPLTDSNGETIGHFVRNEVLYNLKFLKDGQLIIEFLNIRTFCEDFSIGECELILSSTGESSLTPTFDSLFGVTFQSPIYNATTDTVRFDFTSVDATPKTIVINVSRNDVFGNRTLCSDSLTSSSGTLICTVGNVTNTLLIVDVSSDSEPILRSTLQIDPNVGYGNVGFIVWFIFLLVYILAFADNKTGVLIGLSISYIGAIAMGVADGTIVGAASAGIWIIAITLVGIWKINKENPQ